MSHDRSVVNLDEKFGTFTDRWSPRIIAQVNNLHIKAVRVEGAFVWHKHDDTDELFIVHSGRSGRLTIRHRNRDVVLGPGELHVEPRGVEHIILAEEECEILLIEPAGTLNTGDASHSDKSAHHEPWI